MLARWVQMAPGGGTEARAVFQGESCPSAEIDGAPVAMQTRAAPDAKFPVTLCSLALPAAAHRLTVAGSDLPLPVPAPSRILVLGDTGCRIKINPHPSLLQRLEAIIAPKTIRAIQACNDPGAWPFPAVAAAAAKLKPDLVIHVGDYLYRESACPEADASCAGSPWGDNWKSWAADFFSPAKPLLEAAPWVIVRGNHEECVRAGAGFLRLLGPLAFVEGAPCAAHTPPYAVSLGSINLVVMDNASAVDRDPSDALVNTYRSDFEALPSLSSTPTWLAMHHPIWGVVKGPLGIVAGGNETLMAAEAPGGIPSPVSLMLAGHIHSFEAMDYESGLPPQLIVGEGGDMLDAAPANLTGRTVGAARIAHGLSLPGYGFLLMTRDGGRWTVDVYDATGTVERRCVVAERSIDCAKD
jgi:hypothetical protein